ncbi:MAG: cyclic nucleotide-binding domain-containing protein [Magnetococcales bacterium]|nr:cyclic nucleotide-binding domain-containing protein [Magnetococcales bacterium]
MLFHRNPHTLGKEFSPGEIIFRQGDKADCLHVILEGEVEILVAGESDPLERLAVLGVDHVFGEMSLFHKTPRAATARALTQVRVLSVDQRGFLRWLQEDPTLTLRILLKMSERVRGLIAETIRLRQQLSKE